MKRKKGLKFLVTYVLALSLVFALSITSFAGTISKTYSGQFDSEWYDSYSTYVNGASLQMTYGFNTFLINEDCCYTLYYGSSHRPIIKNDRGTFTKGLMQAHEWNDLEVMHKGDSVTYSCYWQEY